MNDLLEGFSNDREKFLVGIPPFLFPQAVLNHPATGHGRLAGEAFDGERSVSGMTSFR